MAQAQSEPGELKGKAMRVLVSAAIGFAAGPCPSRPFAGAGRFAALVHVLLRSVMASVVTLLDCRRG